MSVAIEVSDLQVKYGDFTALKDVSFRLAPESIGGLLGRNGSGKSTLMSVLAGFRKANAGQVLVDGEPVFENARVMRQVCLIREGADTVDGGEKVEEALRHASTLRPNWDGDYAARLLERFQLSSKKKVGELSRGQRAALAVTLGLASRAPFTMYDESYLGMDAPSRYAFYDELLRDFMLHPRTILISTHMIEEVSQLFEDLVILDEGRLMLQDEAEALRSRGATVTGSADAVDALVAGLTVLSQKQLGPTKSVVVYGGLTDELRSRAGQSGVEIGPLPLQDLFVHLTTAGGDANDDLG